jgi:hypothetical protein
MGISNRYGLNKPDRRRSEIEILLESLNKNKRRDKTRSVQRSPLFAPAQKSGDAVEFELSPRAQMEMRYAEIDDVINSGEPLTGVDFKEFQQYYSYKNGFMRREDEMQQLYRQALKGDKASLREHEWLHNPNYMLESRLYSSDEVTTDREAALEKYKNGDELDEFESKLLSTFPNMLEASKMLNEIDYDRQRMNLQKRISSMLSEAGFELSPNTELTFETLGSKVTVSGSGDEETDKKLSEYFTDTKYTPPKCGYQTTVGRTAENIYFHYHKDILNEIGLTRDWVLASEQYLEDEGSGVTVFDLSVDDEENVIGLPEKYAEYINKYAIGEYNDNVLPASLEPIKDDVFAARKMKEAFKSVVQTIQNGNYDNIKGIICAFNYKNGNLEIK